MFPAVMANQIHPDRALLSFWVTKDTKEKLQALALTLDYTDTSDLLGDLTHRAINDEKITHRKYSQNNR